LPHASRRWRVNHKRVHRIWRDQGPHVPYKRHKKPPRDVGAVTNGKCGIRPHVKLLKVVDESTRECLAIEADHSMNAGMVVAP
jgi:hypothetical protein